MRTGGGGWSGKQGGLRVRLRLCYAAGSEGHRIPVVRPDFKSGEARHACLVGSTPISFRLVFPHRFVR